VARAAEKEHIARVGARSENARQLRMYCPAAIAVAPAGHDARAGNDARPLFARPAHGVQEGVSPVRLPVGEEQLRLRCHGVNRLAAKDAMLTGAGLEIAVRAEGADEHIAGQGLAQLVAIAAKTRVED